MKTPRQRRMSQLKRDIGRLFNTTGGPPLWRKEEELRQLELAEREMVG